jgi:hypothetical protein
MGGVMNEVTVNVEEEAQLVAGVLREYAAKLVEYNAEMVALLPAVAQLVRGTAPVGSTWNYSNLAWMLDRFEMINRPLQRVLSRGSALVEHSALAQRTHDEMNLRLRELESQLHHAERQTMELRDLLGVDKHAQAVAKLRYAAGLPAGRGSVTSRT